MSKHPNAIILAAGKSKRLAPFTYEKPKGLFTVRGEVLVERLIKQLKEAGIRKIYLVVGFMKEKYFYLEKKYGIVLLVNNTFENKGNLYSLYVARQYLRDTYVCCVDHYFPQNPFLEARPYSYRICVRETGKQKFAVSYSDANVITRMRVGGSMPYSMGGEAFFTAAFSRRFRSLMEKEIRDFGVSSMFWEEFYARHIDELTLYAVQKSADYVREFDSVEELRAFDHEFFDNINSEILDNICGVLHCRRAEIKDIKIIQKGLTNISFRFEANGIRYVYRHPGGTAGHLVDRETEVIAQRKMVKEGIDASVIHIDEKGWKLSYYIENMVPCDLGCEEHRKKVIAYLDRLHTFTEVPGAKIFDPYREALHLMDVASLSKGNLRCEFSEMVEKVSALNNILQAEMVRPALCHNDTYEPNFLFDKNGELYIIDWEYAGMNDPAYDLACILCRKMYTQAEIDTLINDYLGHVATAKEHLHYMAEICLCGFYWFCWGLYKGSVNDDDGFFMIPAYRNCNRFIDEVLKAYQKQKG